MVDFAPSGPYGKRGFAAHFIHADRHLKDNAEDRVLAILRDAGLADAQLLARRPSPIDSVAYYRATAPAAVGGGVAS